MGQTTGHREWPVSGRSGQTARRLAARYTQWWATLRDPSSGSSSFS